MLLLFIINTGTPKQIEFLWIWIHNTGLVAWTRVLSNNEILNARGSFEFFCNEDLIVFYRVLTIAPKTNICIKALLS
jgi:hypothetical protein